MIAILDACSIFNLINLSGDGTYLKYTEESFRNVQIVPEVYNEFRKNKNIAILSDIDNMLEEIISKTVNRLVDYQDLSRIKEHIFAKFNTRKGGKEDGEIISLCLSLYLSRIITNEKFGENILKIYFVTDDFPAKVEFQEFYQINQIGQIIDTIDLLTIMFLKGRIKKNELIRNCHHLIHCYNRPINELVLKLNEIKQSDNLGKAMQLSLTKIIELLENYTEESEIEMHNTIEQHNVKFFLRKQIDLNQLFDELFKSRNRNKISYIRQRISQLEYVQE